MGTWNDTEDGRRMDSENRECPVTGRKERLTAAILERNGAPVLAVYAIHDAWPGDGAGQARKFYLTLDEVDELKSEADVYREQR
jgi:hypothetical protein